MRFKIFFFILIVLSNSSCINRKIVNGQVPDQDLISTLKVGFDKKELVNKILGSPSFEGTLGDNSLYYVKSISKKFAFLDPSLIDRRVLRLQFDDTNILENIYLYDKNDRKVIKMSKNTTLTSGREIGFLEEFFSGMGFKGTQGQILQGSGRTGE